MLDNPQDEQWLIDRAGSVGASEIADVLRRGKDQKSPSTMRANLMARKICERLTKVPVKSFTGKAMLDGIEKEPRARELYELMTNNTVEMVGKLPHPNIAWTHASPDGLVGERGAVQIKCPEHSAHLETVLTGKVPTDYVKQMNWEMRCAGRDWCDFVSYHPDFPPEMQLHIDRFGRDESLIAEMEKAILVFNEELEAKLAALRFQFRIAEAA